MQIGYGFLGYRSVEQENVNCLIQFLGYCSRKGSPVVLVNKSGDALVNRARGILARKFLTETDADVLLHVDSDIVFTPEDAWTICEAAMTNSIVGGLYVSRQARGGIPLSRLLPNRIYDFAMPGLQECKWLGGGFMAIHRRVFEALMAHPTVERVHRGTDMEQWTFYQPFNVDHEPDGRIELSEDWAIQERAHELGFRSYLHTGVRLGHIGQCKYTLEDLAYQPQKQLETIELNDKAEFHYRVKVERQEVA